MQQKIWTGIQAKVIQETSPCFKSALEMKFKNNSGVWNSKYFINAFFFFLFIMSKDWIQKTFGEKLKETPTQGRKNPQLVLILAFSHVATKWTSHRCNQKEQVIQTNCYCDGNQYDFFVHNVFISRHIGASVTYLPAVLISARNF